MSNIEKSTQARIGSPLPNLEKTWPMPHRDECFFYHTMQFPDGENIPGSWTIPDFTNYIGGYDVRGKTVLDIGTASGYLAFASEQAGAAEVTGLDVASSHELTHSWPFAKSFCYQNIGEWREILQEDQEIPLKKSWWYGWHKNHSKARCVYAPHSELYEWDCMFDVVIAGQIVELLPEPIFSIGAWAKVAREAVIIAFTDVAQEEAMFMRPITDLSSPAYSYILWELSLGLYRKVFDNLDFDIEIVYSNSEHRGKSEQRPTIIARRRYTY